jgi:hypothetical protein
MFLSRYDMHSTGYKNLYQVYKLTFPVAKEHFAKEHFQNVNCSNTITRHVIGRSSRIVATNHGGKQTVRFFHHGHDSIIDDVMQHSGYQSLLLR